MNSTKKGHCKVSVGVARFDSDVRVEQLRGYLAQIVEAEHIRISRYRQDEEWDQMCRARGRMEAWMAVEEFINTYSDSLNKYRNGVTND